MFRFKVKTIPTSFVLLDEYEFKAEDLYYLLEQFTDDDCINDYCLDTKIADILVKQNILKRCPGDKMATLYKKTENFNDFYEQYTKEFFEYLDNN